MTSQMATKVLIVDDETDFVDLMTRRLEARGLDVVPVVSGEEAVNAVYDHSIDVAVVDLSMPGIDGLETLRQVKEKRPDLEVIMLTGHSSVKSGIEAMKSGATDYLEKPVDLQALMAAIRAAKEARMDRLLERSEEEIQHILKSKSW
jgi:DNA-binding NtrC family response regulator